MRSQTEIAGVHHWIVCGRQEGVRTGWCDKYLMPGVSGCVGFRMGRLPGGIIDDYRDYYVKTAPKVFVSQQMSFGEHTHNEHLEESAPLQTIVHAG